GAMSDLHSRFEQSVKTTRVENGVLVGNTIVPVDDKIPAVVIPVSHMDLLSDPQDSQLDVDLDFGESVFRRKSCPRCIANNGSLDQAVSDLLLRNLLVSFGILLLLAISMLIMVVATRRAQRLAQQKMEFVAAISHELRTPLAVIRSAGENLADGVVPDLARARQ